MRIIRTHSADLVGDEETTPDKILAISPEQILTKARAGELRVEAETTVMELKGSRIRSGTTALKGMKDMYVTLDLQTGVFRSVAPSQRLYTEWTAEDLRKMMGDAKKAGATAPTETAFLKLEPVGSTKVIAGFRCAGYRYQDSSTTGMAWLTKDLPDIANALQRMAELSTGGAQSGANRAPYLRFGFPCFAQELKTQEEGAGRDYEITELLAVERKTVADDRFTVPAGFRKETMPTMPR